MSSIPSIPIPIADIPNKLATTLGALFVGATIAAVSLYYCMSLRSWGHMYSRATICRLLDTFHVVLGTHALYFYLIESFGNYLALLSKIIWYGNCIYWLLSLQLLINVLINSGVQALYAVRIWKLGRKFHMVLPRFIVSTGLLSDTRKPCIYTVFSTMSAADFIIAGVMCFYLHKGRSMTTFSNTTKTIVKLMRIVVISGLLTRYGSYMVSITYIVWPDTLIFLAIGTFILPKLYINSLLAMSVRPFHLF
ncbi:hypothetical protein ARMSODRAFT_959916 [Armillaria solidipes]|uniref:DUF6534 domain-containing protein n=1 Tax=Armillaria solidipes TaxID=1076256 RepID=A0A2H3BCX7_9AGAR|nr:hypothetical protein ARMSODRAFT_959916 [Armillaria solidipes]